jgi:hypothetical protein
VPANGLVFKPSKDFICEQNGLINDPQHRSFALRPQESALKPSGVACRTVEPISLWQRGYIEFMLIKMDSPGKQHALTWRDTKIDNKPGFSMFVELKFNQI